MSFIQITIVENKSVCETQMPLPVKKIWIVKFSLSWIFAKWERTRQDDKMDYANARGLQSFLETRSMKNNNFRLKSNLIVLKQGVNILQSN